MKENDSIWVTKFTFDNLKVNGLMYTKKNFNS